MAVNYSSYFEAILTEDAHIRDKTFKVTIPVLFAGRSDKMEGVESSVLKIDEGGVINSKTIKPAAQMELTTIFEAVNHTDYTFQYRGDTFVMEKSQYHTMMNMADQGGIVLAPGHNTPHYHKGKDPIKMWNYNYENLNDVRVKKGTKCYGFFINGIPKTFAVTRIEGAIPLNKGELPKYEK